MLTEIISDITIVPKGSSQGQGPHSARCWTCTHMHTHVCTEFLLQGVTVKDNVWGGEDKDIRKGPHPKPTETKLECFHWFQSEGRKHEASATAPTLNLGPPALKAQAAVS